MKKSIAVYRGLGTYIFHPNNVTDVGLNIAGEPYLRINILSEPEEIVNLIYKVFGAVEFNVPHPKNWDGFASNFQKGIGYSWQKLHKNFAYCLIELGNTSYCIIPCKNNVSRKLWTHLNDKRLEVEINVTSEAFFCALEAAFQLCE